MQSREMLEQWTTAVDEWAPIQFWESALEVLNESKRALEQNKSFTSLSPSDLIWDPEKRGMRVVGEPVPLSGAYWPLFESYFAHFINPLILARVSGNSLSTVLRNHPLGVNSRLLYQETPLWGRVWPRYFPFVTVPRWLSRHGNRKTPSLGLREHRWYAARLIEFARGVLSQFKPEWGKGRVQKDPQFAAFVHEALGRTGKSGLTFNSLGRQVMLPTGGIPTRVLCQDPGLANTLWKLVKTERNFSPPRWTDPLKNPPCDGDFLTVLETDHPEQAAEFLNRSASQVLLHWKGHPFEWRRHLHHPWTLLHSQIERSRHSWILIERKSP